MAVEERFISDFCKTEEDAMLCYAIGGVKFHFHVPEQRNSQDWNNNQSNHPKPDDTTADA